MLLIAFLVMFNIYIFVSSFTFVKSKNGLISLTKEIIGISRFPIDIWSSSIQFVFYTFLPVAFITQVPSKVLIGEYSIYIVLAGIAVLVITTAISRYVWNANIKKYISFGG